MRAATDNTQWMDACNSESIRRYALQAAALLAARGVKCLVVACNTCSAVALGDLAREFAPVPVLGVVEPGARAACATTRSGSIAVVATESTVRGGAYEAAIRRCRPDAVVAARACPLFVALGEEGWTDGPVVEAVAHRYLDDLFAAGGPRRPDTLVLGCTHFPVLAPAIGRVLGAGVAIVDSAETRMRMVSTSKSKAPMNGRRRRMNISSRVRLSFSEHPTPPLWRKWRK